MAASHSPWRRHSHRIASPPDPDRLRDTMSSRATALARSTVIAGIPKPPSVSGVAMPYGVREAGLRWERSAIARIRASRPLAPSCSMCVRALRRTPQHRRRPSPDRSPHLVPRELLGPQRVQLGHREREDFAPVCASGLGVPCVGHSEETFLRAPRPHIYPVTAGVARGLIPRRGP